MPALGPRTPLPNAAEMVSFSVDGEFLLGKRRTTLVGSFGANREREHVRRGTTQSLRNLTTMQEVVLP